MTRKELERTGAAELRRLAAAEAHRLGKSSTVARNMLTREEKILLVLNREWPDRFQVQKPAAEPVADPTPARGTNYPHLGVVASAKVMNTAEADGQFAVEVMLAGIAHREAGKRTSSRQTRHGTLLTVTDERGQMITILAEESTHYGHRFTSRRGGGLQ